MKRLPFLAGIVGIALLLGVTSAAVAEHAWQNYHWERSSNPVTINLGNNVDPLKWGSHLVTAAEDWDFSRVLHTPIVAGNTKPRNCRATQGMVEVCSESYGNTGWLGVAQIWVSGGHIVQAITKVNDYYHDRPPYNSWSWKQLVLCQEIGHTFGLHHQNEDFNTNQTNSCMEYTSTPAGNEHPDAHDYDMLEKIYDHLDGSTDNGGGGSGGGDCWPPGRCKNGQAPPPAFGIPLHDVSQWGRLVATSRNGGKSLFVQDFGGGFRVLTHVTWTLEIAERLRTDNR
jgi:hypothetical protein